MSEYEQIYEDDGIDLNTLRYTLLQCRKELFRAIENLIETEFTYSKVELREDFDRLKISYENLKNETRLLKVDLDHLMENCQVLIEQTKDILAERDSYYSEWQYAKDILTPRPEWDKCMDLIDNWRNLARGKSSDELVEVVIHEILPNKTEEDHEPMLSTHRQIRRRMTGLLIKEIWSKKLFDSKMQLNDYVFDYLTKRFDSQEIAVEISSNIQRACRRYQHHYEINLFWQIVTGQVEERVYHDEMKEFARIVQYFIRSSTQSSIQLSDGLRALYPHWTDERIARVITVAGRELQQSSMKQNELGWLVLFTEDDEGCVGAFLRSIREELHIDKEEYIEKIRKVFFGHPLVSIKQFQRAVQLVDPLISRKELRRYVKWVFEPKGSLVADQNEEVRSKIDQQTQMRDFDEIIYRLERCSCFMH